MNLSFRRVEGLGAGEVGVPSTVPELARYEPQVMPIGDW